MFLDDKLLKIGRGEGKTYIPSLEQRKDSMLVACASNLLERTNGDLRLSTWQTNLHRIDKTFRTVTEQLKKEGIDFLTGNEFKDWVNEKEELKEFHF